jgi:signal transduction histidine kinase
MRGTPGYRSAVGSPINVEGRLWGVISAASSAEEPLPPDTEVRLDSFTELVAMAIANSENSSRRARLAEEQAALRRVATLVADGLEPHVMFAAVARELYGLFGAGISAIVRFEEGGTVTLMGAHGGPHAPGARVEPDPGYVVDAVRATGHAARFDTDDPAADDMPAVVRAVGIRSALASPIVVDGQLWGAVTAATSGTNSMPADAESRMAQFTELVATAVSNVQARTEVERLVAEQTALRRVATLVVRKGSPEEVFAQVAEEVGLLLEADTAGVCRYEPDDHAILVAAWGRVGRTIPVGSRFSLDDRDSVPTLVYRTERPARVEGNEDATGPVGDYAREVGLLSACGAPIFVGGRLWGSLVVGSSRREAMIADAESRMAGFTELVATAISNVQARSDVEELAEEQAALRRVAELVAREASQTEIFTAIAEEIGRLLGTGEMRMMRYESDREARIVARAGELDIFPVGSRWPLEGESVASRIYRTGRPARIDDYVAKSGSIAAGVRSVGIRGVVGTPILVRGQVWGAMLTATVTDQPLPAGTDVRLGQFTDLMATAIANAEARGEVERLAEEQAALRRVATLVAQGARPSAVFDAVAAEMNQVLGAGGVTLSRYEPDEDVVVLAHCGSDPGRLPAGTRVRHRGENVTSRVRASNRSARLEHPPGQPGAIADIVGEPVRASVGAPIVVDGRLWGVAVANWRGDNAPPADTEERMARFAELLDTAIANADSRDQLTASRARLLTEADEARRRVVRDLHDGAQQRLVHTILTLKLAQRALEANDDNAGLLIAEALERAQQGNAELRELAHGILPAVLTHGGLRSGVNSIVSRLDLPVDMQIPAERFPAEIEASAYFVVAEALTNVVKHSNAGRAEVRASVDDGKLRVEIRDDGVGGADPKGHGLVGLRDRVSALGGRLEVSTPSGGGTLLSATLPLSAG